MKNLFIALCFLLPSLSLAQSILIRAPQVSSFEFNRYTEEHKEFLSFLEYTMQRIQSNPRQEHELLQLTDSFNQDIGASLELIKKIEEKSPLTLTSLRFLRDMSEKYLNEKTTPAERSRLLHLYCKSALLLQDGPQLFSCTGQTVTFQNLKRKYPQIENVLIEGRAFSIDETLSLNSNTAYQWVLLSNTQKPIFFFGTYHQIIGQQFNLENLIEGTCDRYATSTLDFDLLLRSQIYFSQDCIKKSQKEEPKESFIQSYKPWLYGAGLLILGGLAYSLKDKNLVFTRP